MRFIMASKTLEQSFKKLEFRFVGVPERMSGRKIAEKTGEVDNRVRGSWVGCVGWDVGFHILYLDLDVYGRL